MKDKDRIKIDCMSMAIGRLRDRVDALAPLAKSGAVETYCALCHFHKGHSPFMQCTAKSHNTFSNPEESFCQLVNKEGRCPLYKPIGFAGKPARWWQR